MTVEDAAAEKCALLRQGDILDVSSIDVEGIRFDSEHGAVLISQTCDIVRTNGRPHVAVALVAQLAGELAAAAHDGKHPRYVPISKTSDLFADLELIATLTKNGLADVTVRSSIDPTDWEVQRVFARGVGRRFSRLALPDELVPWFDPLSELVQKKYDRPLSRFFPVLEVVRQFRIEAPQWVPPGVDITLHIVLNAGELPLLGPDGVGEPSDELTSWVAGGRSISDLCGRLFPADGPRPGGADRDLLWRSLADALAATCRPAARYASDVSVQTALASVVGQVASEEEFTLMQYLASAELDLAHLSAPSTE